MIYSLTCTQGVPLQASLECPAGESLTIGIVLRTRAGAAVDMLGGRFELSIRDRQGAVLTSQLVEGDETGDATFVWTARAVSSLGAGGYRYDVFTVDPDGVRTQIVKPSSLTITPAITAPLPYELVYYGVGDHGLDAVELADLPSKLVSSPEQMSPTVLSPAGQACYWVVPADMPAIAVTLSGFPVPMLAVRDETVATVACKVYETEDLHTGTSLGFEVSL